MPRHRPRDTPAVIFLSTIFLSIVPRMRLCGVHAIPMRSVLLAPWFRPGFALGPFWDRPARNDAGEGAENTFENNEFACCSDYAIAKEAAPSQIAKARLGVHLVTGGPALADPHAGTPELVPPYFFALIAAWAAASRAIGTR